jgi:hypothetical protein
MIAWVTHHLPRDTDSNNSAHLPGKYVGGAEMTDAALLAAAPVDVDIVPAWEWERALDADHVIITGTDLLPTQAMERLAGTSPTVFLHHEQTRAYARRQLIDAARVLILHTPAHEAMERRWTNPKRVELVLSPMDPTECLGRTEARSRGLGAADARPEGATRGAPVGHRKRYSSCRC